MKKILLLGGFVVLCFAANAQTDSSKTISSFDTNKVFTSVDVEAQFEGGVDGWQKYLMKNLNAVIPSKEGAPAGLYRVNVSFIVNKEEIVSDIRAENDPGYGTAKEAVRVIKSSPNWIPATINNQPVISRKKQPINFMVDN